jgi:hypothetical protein
MLYSEDNTTTNQNGWPLFWHGSDTSSPAFSLSDAAGKAAAAIASAIERARTGIDPSASQTVAMRDGPGTRRTAACTHTTTNYLQDLRRNRHSKNTIDQFDPQHGINNKNSTRRRSKYRCTIPVSRMPGAGAQAIMAENNWGRRGTTTR